MTKKFFVFGRGRGFELQEFCAGVPMSATTTRGVVSKSDRLSVLALSIVQVGRMISDSLRIIFDPPPELKSVGACRGLDKTEISKVEKILDVNFG